jgi:tetratricopeptide (TPR) repeat protein
MSQSDLTRLFQRARQHHQAGRLADAEAGYRQILTEAPDHAEALHLLGMLCGQTGRMDAAIDLIVRAIEVSPNVPYYHSNLGIALREKGKLDESIAALRRAIQLNPNLAPAHNNLGIALSDQGRLDDAVAEYHIAIRIDPAYADACNNLGVALNELDRVDEAIEFYRQAIRSRPDFAAAHNNLGTALKDKGRVADAIDSFGRAIQLDPRYSEARWNRALALLLSGDFQNGWREHESRLQTQSAFVAPPRKFSEPQWDGGDLRGRTILLHPEQGLGDTMQFVRYAPLVAGRGGKVILGCAPQLSRLLLGSVGVARIAAMNRPLPRFDVQCPLMSLPLVFATDLSSIPATIPYLFPDPALVQDWQRRIGTKERSFKIGVAWAGNPKNPRDRSRSIGLGQLSPLAEASKNATVQFHSLQKGQAAAQPPPPGMNLTNWNHDLHDFAETAALIANLDLVITVDTAVAHLAGAMAKPVWLLLRFVPDWRWLMSRDDSPWYPTMRLFRQTSPGDWNSPIRKLSEALELLIGKSVF